MFFRKKKNVFANIIVFLKKFLKLFTVNKNIKITC